MITTHRSKVPWTWMVLIAIPWVVHNYTENCSDRILSKTITKFVIDSPGAERVLPFMGNGALIAVLLGVNVAFNFMVGTITNYISDGVWTRWGRRMPFVLLGRLGAGICLFFLPLASNLWHLAGIIVLFQFSVDFATPWEPLYNEVLPPPQRTRAYTFRMILTKFAELFFSAVMMSKFSFTESFTIDSSFKIPFVDGNFNFIWKEIHLPWNTVKLPVTGEQALYWMGGIISIATVLFLMLVLRETPPVEQIRREPFRPKTFVSRIFGTRQRCMLYLLWICPSLSAVVGRTFNTNFVTNQLGWSMKAFGDLTALEVIVGALIFLPLAGYLSTKIPRLVLFQVGIIGPVLVRFAMYLYVKFYSNYQMDFWTMFLFDVSADLTYVMLLVTWGPIIYDHLASNEFGIACAGFAFVTGVSRTILINLAGWWVDGWTWLFGSAGRTSLDYSSSLVLQLITGCAGLYITFYFAREVKRGHVVANGVREHELERQKERNKNNP